MPKEVSIRRIYIPLTELSRIWKNSAIGKNKNASPIKAPGEIGRSPVVEKEWKNEKIQEFYQNCVAPYAGSLPDKQKNAIYTVLEIFDQSETACQTPVIIPDDQDTSEDHHIIRDCLLIDHTLNVATEAQLLHKRNNDHYLSMGSVLLAALSHDIGKIVQIKNQFGKGLDVHVLASSEWLKSHASGISDYDKIFEAVSNHHAGKKEIKARCDPGNYILPILQQANHNVRKRELQESLKNTPNAKKDADNLPESQGQTVDKTEDSLIDFVDGSGNDVVGAEWLNTPKESHADEPLKKCILVVDNTEPDKEATFSKWLDEKILINAVEKNISNDGLACFYFEGDVFITVKTFHKIINEFRIERGLTVFSSTEDTRNYLRNRIQRIRNVHCRIVFTKDKPRKPYKAYYYIIDSSYFDKRPLKSLEPAKDYRGFVLSEVIVLKEYGEELEEPEKRNTQELWGE